MEEVLLGMLAVSLLIAFIIVMIVRLATKKPIKAHMVMYALCLGTGIFTIGFFMSMDIPKIAKIVTTITLGIILIFIAAWREQRVKTKKG
jgi:prolipoprotein diacylglyceryltransferase